MFRDETKKVVRKARAAKPQDEPSSSAVITPDEGANSSELSTIIVQDLATRTQDQIAVRNPPIPMEEQSACFFIRHFTHSDLHGSRAHLNFLPKIYGQEPAYSALGDIMISIGMAAMANKFKCPELILAARRKQTSVLRAINVALQDEEKAGKDSTLMTVILLGTFEVSFSTGQCMVLS